MSKSTKIEQTEVKSLDIDVVLYNLQCVKASLQVMNNSIDAHFATGETDFIFMQAIINHVEKIIVVNIEDIDKIIMTLKESGAKDYDASEME